MSGISQIRASQPIRFCSRCRRLVTAGSMPRQIVRGIEPAVTNLLHREQKRIGWLARICEIPLIRILELGGADQAVRAHALLTRKMMKHQHALAEAVGTHLKASA